MPHTSKKRYLKNNNVVDPPPARRSRRIAGRLNADFDQLDDNVLANILEFLVMNEIMCYRRVSKKWRETINKVVPLGDFRVNNLNKYNGMGVMTRALPNLQQVTLGRLGLPHKWNDGEDPDEDWAAGHTAHNIEIVSSFRQLRELRIFDAGLNGRYPFLFNSFPLLQKLSIKYCYYLKWDLEMLAGMPLLKELDCYNNYGMTGNINSLRVLKDTLEKVALDDCTRVEGNFMDLADFPHLKKLDLEHTAVTGDIRDIGENDFISLEQLKLPKTVYGAKGFTLQSISDGPDVVRAVYLLKKKILALDIKYWHGELSRESPDWYEPVDSYFTPVPPFNIWFFEAGSRIGYRWTTISYSRSTFQGWQYLHDEPCEVNWLDPEPDRESSDYGKYIGELQKTNRQVNFYKGFHQPPTEEEYNRLHEVLQEEGEWW
jgi:hypothetical protein